MTSEVQTRPWWASVTLEELAGSRGLVRGLLALEVDISALDVKRFARALVIQHLCVSDAVLPDALSSAIEVTHGYDVEGAEQLDVVGKWLDRCSVLLATFEHALALLGDQASEPQCAQFREFVMAVPILRGRFNTYLFSKGVGKDFVAPTKVSFRRSGV